MDASIIVALIGFLGTAITVLVPLLVSQNKIDKKLDKHIEENEQDKADEWRAKILTFDDGICRGQQYSEESWSEILSVISRYELFCKDHEKTYKNNKCLLGVEHIKAVYKKVKENNSFLTHIETIK